MSATPSLGLFAHDFDSPMSDAGVIVLDESDPAEAPPLPVTAEMLEAARDAAFAEGLRVGRAEAAMAREAAQHDMTTRLVEQMNEATAGLRDTVEQCGGQLAQLVMAAIGAAFPALCTRLGGAEVERFTRAILALLAAEPRIVIRVHPGMAADAARAVAALEPESRAAVEIEARETMAPGDARIAWRHGTALRDARTLWDQAHEALAMLDLIAPQPMPLPVPVPMPPSAAVVPAAPAHAEPQLVTAA